MASDITEEQIEEKKAALVPATMDGILTFAESYEAPETVEAVFKWDVSDIFYNYFIVGASIDVGGINGDDSGIIDIYNQKVIVFSQGFQLCIRLRSLHHFHGGFPFCRIPFRLNVKIL